MGACPYCRSTALPSDTICYSCGRVLPQGDRSSYRMEQQFSQKGTRATSYKMAKKPSQRGVVQTHTGRQKNIMKRRKNRFRSVVMLGLVAFIMLSPQAQEALLGDFGGVEEFLQSQLAPYHQYPNEATYTLAKVSDISMTGAQGDGMVTENILIPPVLNSALSGSAQFSYTNGDPGPAAVTLQETLELTLVVAGQSINIPIDGMPDKPYADRIITAAGHEVWWPPVGTDAEECPVAKCVKVRVFLNTDESVRYSFEIRVKSTSYSWWNHDSRVDAKVAGKSHGIGMETSGTFADIGQRGNGVRQSDFGGDEWYFRDNVQNYAINGADALVMSTADAIAASLPEGESSNAYGFARAAFDYLHAYVSYDRLAPGTARSGPECLAAKTGDCDEQTNAFFSIMRTRGIPGWYTFGVLGDPFLSSEGWEAHAWGYILLPMKESWCDERGIVLQSCFVEAQVDVVNNKWLLSTPTAYVDWVEEADSSGTLVYEYYHPVSSIVYTPGANIERVRTFETVGDVEFAGGSYKVKKYAESLG